MEIKKKYRLPKETAEKWIEALKSGEYLQGKGRLRIYIEQLRHPAPYVYCCMGVLGKICGVPEKLLEDTLLHAESLSYGIPKEIATNGSKELSYILASLNDGMYENGVLRVIEDWEHPKIKELLETPEKDRYSITFTFKDIAEIIEKNVELY